MVATAERQIWMLVIHDRLRGGFHLALVPAHLDEEQVEGASEELGIDGEAMFELGGWKTAGCGVTVAHVPMPPSSN